MVGLATHLGAALIISAGPRAWLNRTILSSRLLVWCGLISFPLYLWHWPLLAFPRDRGAKPRPTKYASICRPLIELAALTYRWSKAPLRFNALRRRDLAVSPSGWRSLSEPMRSTFNPEQWSIYFGDLQRYLPSKRDKPIDIAIIGGSDAEHLFIGHAEAIPSQNISYYLRNGSACRQRSGLLQYLSVRIIRSQHKDGDHRMLLASEGLAWAEG